MADPEQLPAHTCEARTESQVVPPVGNIDYLRTVHPWRNHYCADRVGVPLGLPSAQLQSPGLDGESGAFREAVMPGEDILQTFFHQHCEGFTKTVEQRKRWRVREVPGRIRVAHIREVEEDPGQPCAVLQRERLLACADDS